MDYPKFTKPELIFITNQPKYKTYSLAPARLFSFILQPLFMLFCLIAGGLIGYNKSAAAVAISIGLFIGLAYTVPFYILFYQHYRYSQFKKLIIHGKDFKWISFNEELRFTRSDIQKIIQYKSHSKIWGQFCYWEITIANQSFMVSSLIISEFVFESYFFKETQKVSVAWPQIKTEDGV